MNSQSLLIIALGILAFFILKRWFARQTVSSPIVKAKLDSGAVVIDVRSPDEFRDGAFPNAVNIPVSDLRQRLGEVPKDKPVVVYCASGMRSAMAARTLMQAGYTDVTNAGTLDDMPR